MDGRQRQDSGEYVWMDGREHQNEEGEHDCLLACVVFQVAMRYPHKVFRVFENTDGELKGERWALADS